MLWTFRQGAQVALKVVFFRVEPLIMISQSPTFYSMHSLSQLTTYYYPEDGYRYLLLHDELHQKVVRLFDSCYTVMLKLCIELNGQLANYLL